MTIDVESILVLIVITGLGTLTGYWGRIAGKVEDRRDEIYLKGLPVIYSSTLSLTDSFRLFLDGGPLKQLTSEMSDIMASLKSQIFSGDILLFKEELHKELLDFYQNVKRLRVALEEIQKVGDKSVRSDKEKVFRLKYNNNENFPYGDGLLVNPSTILKEGEEINKIVKEEIRRYKSYSWRLTVLIFVIGAVLGLLEVFKITFLK